VNIQTEAVSVLAAEPGGDAAGVWGRAVITIHIIRPGLFPQNAIDFDLCLAPTPRGTWELLVIAYGKWRFVSDHDDQAMAEAAADRLKRRLEAHVKVPR
jgi:hypothetical protein